MLATGSTEPSRQASAIPQALRILANPTQTLRVTEAWQLDEKLIVRRDREGELRAPPAVMVAPRDRSRHGRGPGDL
jgi:hypothetical protein